MPARLAIEREMLRVLMRRDPAIAHLPSPPQVTTAAGSTVALRDSALGRGSTHASRYDGRSIKITELVASGPAVGETSMVDDAGHNSIDQLTVSPAFSATVQSGTDYHIYPVGYGPEELVSAINDVLAVTDAPYLHIPSIITDHDFAANDLANWPAVGTPSAREFVTTAAHILIGDRALHVTADAAAEGAQSLAANVHETEQLILSTFIRVVAGTCRVQLYDETNALVIEETTVDEQAFTEVRFLAQPATGCEQVRVRWISQAASDEWYVSPFVTVQPLSLRPYALPSWWQGARKVWRAGILRQGLGSIADLSFVALSGLLDSAPLDAMFRHEQGVTPNYYQTRAWSGGPAALLVYRPLAELTSDTASTVGDQHYVAWKALAGVFANRADAEQALWRRRAIGRGDALGYNRQAVVIEERTTVV